jgi:hypothetical protein
MAAYKLARAKKIGKFRIKRLKQRREGQAARQGETTQGMVCGQELCVSYS